MKNKKPTKRKLLFDTEGLQAFSQQLKTIRKREGFTQSQLAFEAGISLSQVARIETARINPTLSTVFAIARAMNISLPSLFDFSLTSAKKN